MQTHVTFALAMPHCMQTPVIVSYLHFDVDAHLVPSHTCCLIYLLSHDRRKLAMLTTCRLVTVSHLCYLPAVARPSHACYANYISTCRSMTVSHLLCYLHAIEWPSQTFYPTYMQTHERIFPSALNRTLCSYLDSLLWQWHE